MKERYKYLQPQLQTQEIEMGDTNKDKELVSNKLRAFAHAFVETAQGLGVTVEINTATLDILGTSGDTRTAIKQLVDALNSCMEELLNSDSELEDILPMIHIVDDYLRHFKHKLRHPLTHLNRTN